EAAEAISGLDDIARSDADVTQLALTRAVTACWGRDEPCVAVEELLRAESRVTSAELRQELQAMRAGVHYAAGQAPAVVEAAADLMRAPSSPANLVRMHRAAVPALALTGRIEQALVEWDRCRCAAETIKGAVPEAVIGLPLAGAAALRAASRLAEADQLAAKVYRDASGSGVHFAAGAGAQMLGMIALDAGRVADARVLPRPGPRSGEGRHRLAHPRRGSDDGRGLGGQLRQVARGVPQRGRHQRARSARREDHRCQLPAAVQCAQQAADVHLARGRLRGGLGGHRRHGVRRPRRDPPAEEGDRGPRPRRGKATVHGVTLRQLFSDREPDLPRLYAYPDGHWLRANMVATADGAASLNGLTQGISSATDRRVFALLRTLCDVILVGASTVREEKYKPARPQELWSHLREGRPPTPPIAVVSRRLDLDPDSPLITAAPAHARTIVITVAQAPADSRAELARYADVIVAGDETVDTAAAVSALTKRSHRRMLAEVAEAGLLDELCLTIGPLMAGPGAPRIVAGPPGTGPVATPLPLTLAH